MGDGRERLDRSYRERIKELNRRLSDHRGGMSPEERAVIEAAKAFYVERQEPNSGHSIEELTFWQAVRALQEVDGE